MKIVGLADGSPTTIAGRYVVECDVEANGGAGSLRTTSDPGQAKPFADPEEGMEYWKRESAFSARYPDTGRPNRPLTAYTVMLERYPPLRPF